MNCYVSMGEHVAHKREWSSGRACMPDPVEETVV